MFWKKGLIRSFLNHYVEQSVEQENYQLFPLIGAIIEYSHQLEHLDTLIESFHHYHKEEHVVPTPEQE